ncbi:hypothetical protein DEO72_LG5g1117 [Vigna unguiculata]|uniref:Uncharacterized protein n=1 Tax=Vigna unguiculata TaxID=3917 RepID=A0A4D6LYJ6_VIGUN|nr:hypothetical protein DEO72_LG5g1117 [Vigna unguiculata]
MESLCYAIISRRRGSLVLSDRPSRLGECASLRREYEYVEGCYWGYLAQGLAQARMSSLKRDYVDCIDSKGSPRLMGLA